MLTQYSNENSANGDSGFLRSLRRYVVVGGIATATDWAVFSVLVFGLDMHYLLAGVLSFVVATFAGYLSGLRLVFRGGRHSRWTEVALVYAVSAIGLALHAGVLVAVVAWLQMHPLVGKAAATAVTFLWNFATRYFWIFERDNSDG